MSSYAQIQASRLAEGTYGHFDACSSEYVITDVLTPRPWTNVMANPTYGLVVSQTGGGFSWVENSQLRRLTRWEQDLVRDDYGRWVYVVDDATSQVHSTTFGPVKERAIAEEVRVGLGYTVYVRQQQRFTTRQTTFVPLSGSFEHMLIEIENTTTETLDLTLGSFVEWFLGGQGEWHREFHRLFISMETTEHALFAWKRTGLDEGTRIPPEAPMTAFLGLTGLSGVEWFTDKLQFLGRAGRLHRPEALVSKAEPVVTGRWDDPVGAFRARVAIAPGESLRFALTLGAESNRSEATVSAGASLDQVEARLAEVQDFYRARAGSMHIESSDPTFDLMNNAWLPYQAEVGRMVARCAYYQQGGAYGFRDQLQDSLSLLDTDPPATLRQIEIQSEAMYEDGGVRHWWHPDSTIYCDSHHSDTCLWLSFGLLAYLDETGDLGVIEKPTRFLNRETKTYGRTGTLLDHCLAGIERMLNRRSPRGLPLIGAGDWNDGLSHAGLDGRGESVWLAMFGYHILTRMAEVLDRTGQPSKAARLRTEAKALELAVETYGWDGDWYIAGTSDNGQPFGSKSNHEGSIFLNPQTWAAITGIGARDRRVLALQSAKEQLVKPYGALLLNPAYKTVDPYVGYITRYAPGLRENGGVYSHASAWAVQAFAQEGDIETAYAIFRGMLPPNRAAENSDVYQAEPYVMPGNVDGPDSPYEGRAGWTWYTGSAAWMRQSALHWLLGLRSTLDGLVLQPNLPEGLGRVTLERPYRGDLFRIEIEPGSSTALYVDGKIHEGGPIAASGQAMTRTIQAQTVLR